MLEKPDWLLFSSPAGAALGTRTTVGGSTVRPSTLRGIMSQNIQWFGIFLTFSASLMTDSSLSN